MFPRGETCSLRISVRGQLSHTSNVLVRPCVLLTINWQRGASPDSLPFLLSHSHFRLLLSQLICFSPPVLVYMSPSCVRQDASRSSYSSVLSSISLRLAQFVCDTCHFTQGERIVHIPTVEDKLKFTSTIVGKLTLLRFLLSFVWLIGIKADRGGSSLRTLRLCGEQDLFDSSRFPLRFPLSLFLRSCSPSRSVVNRSICCSGLERSSIDRGSYNHCQLATVCQNVRYTPSLLCRVCVCQCLGFRKTGNCILCTKCQWWD